MSSGAVVNDRFEFTASRFRLRVLAPRIANRLEKPLVASKAIFPVSHALFLSEPR